MQRRRRLDFDTLPVQRLRLNDETPMSVTSSSPTETDISVLPDEMLTQIMTNLDAPTLAAMRRQSTRMASIGRPIQKPACMNQLMITVRHAELIRELHTAMNQSPESLGAIIKQFAVRVQPHMNPEEGNVWVDTTFGYLRFTEEDDITEDDSVNVKVETRDNPIFGQVRGAPGSPWNARCISGNGVETYWDAFVMQTVHCHLRGRFAVNPVLAQSVFVIDSHPELDVYLTLDNGHDTDNYPLSDFVEEDVTDLQFLKWMYCAISLGVLLFDELGFLCVGFFENMYYVLLPKPIDMFGIKTDIVPIVNRLLCRQTRLFKSGLGPQPEARMSTANAALWLGSDLKLFFDEYVPRILGFHADRFGGSNPEDLLERVTALNNTTFPGVRDALKYFYASRLQDAAPRVSAPNFLDHLKALITEQ